MLKDLVGSAQSMWCPSVHPCVFPLLLLRGTPWQKRIESADTGTASWAELTGNYRAHKSWNPSDTEAAEGWGRGMGNCILSLGLVSGHGQRMAVLGWIHPSTTNCPSAFTTRVKWHRNDWQPAGKVTFHCGVLHTVLLRAAGWEHLHCVPYATSAFHVVHSCPVLSIEILQLLLAQPRDLHLGTDTQGVS